MTWADRNQRTPWKRCSAPERHGALSRQRTSNTGCEAHLTLCSVCSRRGECTAACSLGKMQSLSVPLFLLRGRRGGPQAARVSFPIIFSQGKKQMVNSTEKNIFFKESILIKDVWEALTESRPWNQGLPRVRGEGKGDGGVRRLGRGGVAVDREQAPAAKPAAPPGPLWCQRAAWVAACPREPGIWWGLEP